MKHERTEPDPYISGAAGIPPGADPAQAEEAGLCGNRGAGAGLHRGRIPVRSGVCRSCPAVLFAGWADLRGGKNMTREDLERIADELEEVINSSVFDPYSREEDAIRKAMDELRWKAEEME